MRTEMLLVLLLSAASAAQESRGPFVGLPAALSVNAGAPNPAMTLRKLDGFTAVMPGAYPNHDLGAILAMHGGGAGLDVDDFTMGLDWIQVNNDTGRTLVPGNQWAGVTLSVTSATAGAAGSRIAAEAAQPGGAGAAVFSYVFRGSALPLPLVGTVERVHAGTEMGLPRTMDVDGLDQLMPMWDLQPEIRAMLPLPQRIFFTVSNASLPLVPVSWWGGSIPSGATVFVVISSSGIVWSPPQVWMTYAQLGLQTADDIDGLAIDLPDQRILFSLAGTRLDQLQFGYYGTDVVVPQTLKDPDGTPVSTSIGLVQNDDVDAICAMDPSFRTHISGVQNAQFFYFGTPRPPALLPVAALHGSACRGYSGGVVQAHMWTNGWPPVTGQVPGFAAVFLTFGNSLAPVFSLAPAFARDTTPLFVGDPQHFQLAIPGFVVLGSTPVTLRWFAADAGFTELAEGWPVRLEL
jgi:hypothetical protein